jgi:hypothetical protein
MHGMRASALSWHHARVTITRAGHEEWGRHGPDAGTVWGPGKAPGVVVSSWVVGGGADGAGPYHTLAAAACMRASYPMG